MSRALAPRGVRGAVGARRVGDGCFGHSAGASFRLPLAFRTRSRQVCVFYGGGWGRQLAAVPCGAGAAVSGRVPRVNRAHVHMVFAADGAPAIKSE